MVRQVLQRPIQKKAESCFILPFSYVLKLKQTASVRRDIFRQASASTCTFVSACRIHVLLTNIYREGLLCSHSVFPPNLCCDVSCCRAQKSMAQEARLQIPSEGRIAQQASCLNAQQLAEQVTRNFDHSAGNQAVPKLLAYVSCHLQIALLKSTGFGDLRHSQSSRGSTSAEAALQHISENCTPIATWNMFAVIAGCKYLLEQVWSATA